MSASIGSVLKEARDKKTLTLEAVHSKTKIHPRVLQLLEDDKFDKLPSPLFARSFLKSYAEFLEVDSEELLKNYEKMGLKNPEQTIFIRPAEETLRKPVRIDSRTAVTAAVILAGVCFVVLFFFAARSLKERFLRPAGVQTQTAKAKAPKDAAWLRSVAQGNFPEIRRNAPLELQVKALDNVWLRVTCDGKVLFQAILKRGASETWKARAKIEIWTGNSSNMYLALNGFGIGSPGKGVIKKMSITHEGVKIAQ
ncbi:MAG: DUF4115 domain-containing protein [Candidatus Omnitrophica bacterium]|nr:DUF4115 domain-containing protein [Candidatus Omnitrophota bacterium]